MPGACGEFVQGRLDGRDFLVNGPIDRYLRLAVAGPAAVERLIEGLRTEPPAGRQG